MSHNAVKLLRACHATQCILMLDFIPPDLWPLNSPDLNPADYSFWSIMQEKVYQTHIVNIDELKHRLVQVWAELDHRHIAAAIGQQRHCLDACDLCVKAQRDILNNICVEFICSPLGYLLNSWPM